MSSKAKSKGSAAERAVARFLKDWWPLADREGLAGRKLDKGDIRGVPLTVIEVKAEETFRLPKWIAETLRERDNADAPLCLLVVKVKYKPVGKWDAWMPISQLGEPGFPEGEAWTWTRMDLLLAAAVLERLIKEQWVLPSRLLRSSPTTGSS